MNIPILRKASGCRGKVEWNAELEAEYNAVIELMQKLLKLSPYQPKKKLREGFKKKSQTLDIVPTGGEGVLKLSQIY